MDKKEPPDSNGKVNFSQSKHRSKSKPGDRRHNPLPQLNPVPHHSYVEPQPSLLRRRLMEAQHSYIPSYTQCYRSPCESSSHYGTSGYSPRRPIYSIISPYGYLDTLYPPRVLPCAHSSPVRRVGLSSPVPSHGFPLTSRYDPTLCRRSYYESYARARLRDFQPGLCRSVQPRVTNEFNVKRKVTAAQQTSDRSESEAESSQGNDENGSRLSVNFTKCYDPCAGRERLLDTIMQMDDPNYEELCSADDNETENGIADEADEMLRIRCSEKRVKDICGKYRRKSSEKDLKRDEKVTHENNTGITGEVEKEKNQSETQNGTVGDNENAENAKLKDDEATDENVDTIDKETVPREDDLDKEKHNEDIEQKEETKTDENLEESETNKPNVETAQDNTHEELVQDLTADIETKLNTLLQNLDTNIPDETTNILSKYILNTSRGSVIYHMSCSSVEHVVKFIKEIHPQFNLDRCQSLPSIDMSQVIDAPLSSNIRTTLAFPSQSWGNFCNHACPKRTTSFSSDAISLYLQHLDISELQPIAEATKSKLTPVNSSILGDIESEVIRNSLEESTEMFAQDLNGYSSSEILPCTKTVTFITPEI
ncbi:hypothetical protein WDU94_011153 [Cyamophila willieti]